LFFSDVLAESSSSTGFPETHHLSKIPWDSKFHIHHWLIDRYSVSLFLMID
jgi:hypothetical protein